MNPLKIKGEEDTPIVDFDAKKGSLKITGRSIPEDTVDFYQPILDWLDDYLKNPAEETTMDIQLDYCNSFSRKYLLAILKIMKLLIKEGYKVNINWIYEKDDEEMLEDGINYGKMIQLDINTVAI